MREQLNSERTDRLRATMLHVGAVVTALAFVFGASNSVKEKVTVRKIESKPAETPLTTTIHEISCSADTVDARTALPPNSTNTLRISSGSANSELVIYIHKRDAVDAVSETSKVHEEMNLSEFKDKSREVSLYNPSALIVFSESNNPKLPLQVAVSC